MKTLLLALALTLSATAETLGTLGQVNNITATFLEGSEAHTYAIPPELARRLAQRGPGSRWEYNPEGSQIQTALDRGNDANVQAAMQTLSQFVNAVNKQQWPAAQACLPARTAANPQTYFAKHTLSPHPGDWTLKASKPDQIVLKILSTRGGIYDEGYDTTSSPTAYTNEFTLTRQGYRWLIESFR